MDEQVVKESATPADEHRDAARAALSELVKLSASTANREVEIEQAQVAALAEAEKALTTVKSNLELRVKALHEEIEQKYQARAEQIAQQAATNLGELKAGNDARVGRIRAEYERHHADVGSKMQQAVWLSESVLEGVQNGLKEESKNRKEEHGKQLEALDAMEREAVELVATYRQTASPDIPIPTESIEGDPQAAFDAMRSDAERKMLELKSLGLAGLFVGVKPFLVALPVVVIGAAVSGWIAAGKPMQSGEISTITTHPLAIAGGAVGGAVVMGILLMILKIVAKKHVHLAHSALRKSIADARVASAAIVEAAAEQRSVRRAKATNKRNMEVTSVKAQYQPQLTSAANRRDAMLATTDREYKDKVDKVEAIRAKAQGELDAWQKQNIDHVESRLQSELAAATTRYEAAIAEAKRQTEADALALKEKWESGLLNITQPLEQNKAGTKLLKWDDPAWKTWTPAKTFNPRIRFGELRVDIKQITEHYPRTLQLPPTFAVPAALALPRHASLAIHFDRSGRQQAIAVLQTVMVRLLTNLPAGRVRFTLIDPVGLGQNFAGFMHLADHDEALVGGRIWTEAEHIDQRLADLTEHMETVIQKYLRNEFETIDDYNAQAGELAEPYRFLVIADLPTNFSTESMRRLAAIASTGARCGVYTLVTRDLRQPLPGGSHFDEIESASINITQGADGKFIWNDDVFKQFPLTLDAPPSEDFLTRLMDVVGKAAKIAKRVEVAFSSIAPPAEKFWSGSTAADVVVPIGRAGATRLQTLRLGRGVAQHAIIAGKTGSGKSTLLHALVTNLAMWYSPDEVEFYLVDFKKGVEFKTYATNELPHARAIAVESDREFGLSVLQRIDAELTRRGNLFRAAGTQEIGAYRSQTKDRMPRTLLIIDEFQEFFSEDDKLSQDAAVLLDRLVRQGRAFGIHVLLGSQTIGGSSGLSRSTIGQMAIRIALQTSEADSQLILGDNNSAARLLSRPGEAIYNDAGGLVENNSPFQIAWLGDDQRDKYLQAVRDRAKADGIKSEPAIVFEGNAPANIRKNRKLLEVLSGTPALAGASAPPRAYLGDPVAIKEPTSVVFRRQAGANVLIVGQQDELAMALLASSIISLAAQSKQAKFYAFDGTPADSSLAGVMNKVQEAIGNRMRVVDYRDTEAAIAELADELARRNSEGGANPPPIYLLFYGLQRYRALRKSEDSGFSFGSGDEEKKPQADKQFADILRDGPPAGMHTLAWCDTAAALDRTLDRGAMREFDNRILFQMSANDSSNLIDSPTGNKLGSYRALLYSEEQGVMEKFRPYALPGPKWLAYVQQQLKN